MIPVTGPGQNLLNYGHAHFIPSFARQFKNSSFTRNILLLKFPVYILSAMASAISIVLLEPPMS